ncbi:MAG: glycosyltransferase family 2 protein [Xanthomonadales bacterium]|nr:glycosyltransferase family 2 protein [Xanthomonadales bacterium]
MTTQKPSIDLIVPCYNEALSMPELMQRMLAVCGDTEAEFNIIAVDDGSSDGTFEAWQTEAQKQAVIGIRVIRFSRNFGKEIAISCGLQNSHGDAAIVMDADMQDPPELIPEMLQQWQEGFDSVIAVRSNRDSDSAMKRFTAKAFYSLMGRIADIDLPHQAGDFRLLSARLVLALNAYPERTRFMKGLFASLGFKQKLIHFERVARNQGKSSFGFWKLWNFALDGITSFSSLPLRIWGYFGFLLAFTGFLYAIYIIVRTIIFGVDLPGYPSILVFILFFSGIQLISIGVLGEYIGRLFTEVKQRPMYLVSESFGFEKDDEPGPLPPDMNPRRMNKPSEVMGSE